MELNIEQLLNIQTNVENTYTDENGLLRCKTCGEPRETEEIIEFFGKRMPVICACDKRRIEREEREKEIQNKLAMLDRLKKASLLDGRYLKCTFGTTKPNGDSFNDALRRCRKFCEISNDALKNGYGMYIYGNSGNGKTHLTACICNELIKQYKQVLFTNFFEISKMLKASFNQMNESNLTINRLCDVDFLIVDDFGTERVKKNGEDNWLQEQIYDIINKRYNKKKPTIFTSNYSLNELITERGMMEKTVDRINEMSTAIIKVIGKSYRTNNKPKIAPF